MPMRNQTQSRISARAAYARNAMKVEGPKRGRPRSSKVSEPSERILSEDPKNSKTVVRKRQKSVGKKRNIGKVENNSSEADCSSEGEEADYTDEESKVAGSDGEEIEESDEGDASSELEENSAEGEEDSADEAADSADEVEDSADEDEASAEEAENSDEEEEELDGKEEELDGEEEDLDDEEESLNEEEEDSDADEDDIDEQSSFQDEDKEDNEKEATDEEEEADDEEADEEEVRYSFPDPKKISPAGKKKTSVKDSAKHERQKTAIKKNSSDGNLVSKRASPKKKEEIVTENESPKRERPKADNKNKSEKAALTNSDKQKKEKTKTPDQSEAAERERQRAENRSEEDEIENLSLQNHVNSDEQQNMTIKTTSKNDITHTSTKRKINNETSDEDEDMILQNGFNSNKQQKKIRRENQHENDLIEENNHIVSAAPFQRLLNRAAAGSSVSHSNSKGGRKKKRSTSFNSSLGPPLSLNKFYESVPCGNVAADEAFKYLLHPTTPDEFFRKEFENSPFPVFRYRPNYYKELFSNEDLNTMIKENNLEYGVHIDVLKYVDGQRIPVEAAGKAYYSNVWEDYKEGFSIRVRNPQAYNKNIWNLCSLLQEYFSCSVGVNVYLTPPNAQGFPPHYDDIDAFILQIEGIKHWKVYAPRNPSEDLARYSSIDFKENEIGPVFMEYTLSPGDLLYIPRGYIHQAATDEHFHSLHLTLSTNQLNTWGDLLLSATRKAIEKAILNDVHFRKAVPRDFMNYAGVTASEESIKQRAFLLRLKKLAAKAVEYIDPDEAADAHALRFIRCSLPPTFNKIEQERSIHGNGSCWKDGAVRLKSPIELDTEVRIIRKRNQRLVIDESGPKIFHNLENNRDPKDLEEEGQEGVYIDFDMEGVPAFTYLLQKHPTFVKVVDLPIVDTEDRISFATSLYENGLLMTKYPVPTLKDDYDWMRIPDYPVIKVEKDD